MIREEGRKVSREFRGKCGETQAVDVNKPLWTTLDVRK